jgi:uncharacterized protein YgiB involved in biofilm formation
MKKSHAIRLVLLGSAGVALAACDNGVTLPRDAQFYASANECAADHGVQPCEDAKAEADKAQVAEAPRFNQKQQCEQEYGVGNCEARQESSGGGSFFMPMMMGYMMGNMLGGRSFSQPVYRGPDNTAVIPNGGRPVNVGRFDNLTGGSGNRAAFRPAAQVAEVSRGGFGSTSRSFSGTAGG